MQALTPGDMIILDNSDWHPKTAAMLLGSGVIQVDFTGFNPTPRYERLPMPGVGAGLHVEDPE